MASSFIFIAVTMALVAMTSAQVPGPTFMPFLTPGVIYPGIDVKFVISAAGKFWNQPRAIDSLAYVCTDILPKISTAFPTVIPEETWKPFCQPIEDASSKADFNAVELCDTFYGGFTAAGLIPSDETNQLPVFPTLSSTTGDITSAEEILPAVIKITEDIYGIKVTDLNTICPAAERFLVPSIPSQVVEFAAEFISAIMRLAEIHLCDNWDQLIASMGNQTSILNDLADTGARALYSTDRAGLCTKIMSVIAEGAAARKTFGETLIKNALMVLTEADRCKTTSADIIEDLQGLIPQVETYTMGQNFRQYTGYESLDEICDATGANFDTFTADSKATQGVMSMTGTLAALVTVLIVVFNA